MTKLFGFISKALPKTPVVVSLVAILVLTFGQVFVAQPAQARFNTYVDYARCTNAPTKPTLNFWPVTYSDFETPACHDFPLIDAAVDDGSLGFSVSQSDWNDGLYLESGDQGVALMYIHNGASNQIDRALTTAKNVRVTTVTDTALGSTHTLSVSVAGDNTNTARQSFTVHTPDNSRLEVIPNSGFMFAYNGAPILDQQRLNLGNSTYTLGDLAACFEYSIFLSYKFRVVTNRTVDPGSTRIEQAKEAYNETQGVDATATVAERGDYITYKLRAVNYGDATRNDYVIKDDLSRVLPYADIVDYGGGKRSGESIVYPAVDIRPDQTITRQFRVRVKTSLAKNQSYRLVNDYGNRVVIDIDAIQIDEPPVNPPPFNPPPVNPPPVNPTPIYRAPHTGSALVSGLVFASLFTLGFAVIRQRQRIWRFIKA